MLATKILRYALKYGTCTSNKLSLKNYQMKFKKKLSFVFFDPKLNKRKIFPTEFCWNIWCPPISIENVYSEKSIIFTFVCMIRKIRKIRSVKRSGFHLSEFTFTAGCWTLFNRKKERNVTCFGDDDIAVCVYAPECHIKFV